MIQQLMTNTCLFGNLFRHIEHAFGATVLTMQTLTRLFHLSIASYALLHFIANACYRCQQVLWNWISILKARLS